MSEQALWQPSEAQIEASALDGFRRDIATRFAVDLPDYRALHRWSVENRSAFWQAVWDRAGIVAGQPATTVLRSGDKMPDAVWFEGARLNYAENLLRQRGPETAIVGYAEGIELRRLSRDELYARVAAVAAGLKRQGVQAGDRVAGFVANIPEAIIAFLASASLGAIWSSCSPDFGARGVLDRFGQIEPKVLFAVDGYRYNGKRIDCAAKLNEVMAQLPSCERLVVIPFLDPDVDAARFGDKAARLDEFAPATAAGIEFTQLPFDQPLYVLYSSGTTGVPKAIIHCAGGALLQHVKEHILQGDTKPGDCLYFFTTCGWMMWNWTVSALAVGAAVALYDGSPSHPDGGVQFELAAREGVSHFGAGAKFYDAIRNANMRPKQDHDLTKLRTLYSTGSPLAPETFDYLYDALGPDLHLASISGGTDIVSCFVLGNPISPVYRGEIQGAGLGMDVQVWNDRGERVFSEKGELVCAQAFPVMPVGFWGDSDGARYRSAYFARFDNVWMHGDYAEETRHGGFVIHGRSDAVLNPGGVRIGTAEIYRVVESLDEVHEAVCVGQDWDNDVRVVLFVRLNEGAALDEALTKRIKTAIRQGCTPRHVPAKVLQVADIPRTLSGKIAEIAVRDVIHGRTVKNTEALANKASLDLYRGLAELGV